MRIFKSAQHYCKAIRRSGQIFEVYININKTIFLAIFISFDWYSYFFMSWFMMSYGSWSLIFIPYSHISFLKIHFSKSQNCKYEENSSV